MRPNIIIVMTDQQRADLRKSRDYPLDTMPFLDQWAKGGVDFDRAYTPNPTCMPARVSLFTGRYPQCHHVRTNHNAVDALYTEDLLDIVKSLGYRTALCGKNHSHRKNDDFDFHETNGHLGGEGEKNRTRNEELFSEFLSATSHMESHVPSPGGKEAQYPFRNVSAALRFIDETECNVPFFVWVSFAEPHNPYQVCKPYFDMFPPDALPPLKTSAADAMKKGERFKFLQKTWKTVLGPEIGKRIQRVRSNYHGMLRLIDDQFKRLIAGLDSRGLNENTLVVYLSDHGDFVGEYGLIRKGADLPEVLTRIPMIWNGPGVIAKGVENHSCVSLVDLLPTLCDMLQVPVPVGCQGKSIWPLLSGQDIAGHEFDVGYSENGYGGLYWNQTDQLDLATEGALSQRVTFDCLNTWSQCGQVRMARKGDYKIQADMMGTCYLYNLDTDPLETNNLWDDPSFESIKLDMLKTLLTVTLRNCDPLPLPHHRYRQRVHPRGYWNQEYQAPDTGVINMKPLNSYFYTQAKKQE